MSRIITFYSYKGGTGRSMALANVAWILASTGKRVLAIDWDLEAPGLHRYFSPFLTDKELTGQESQGVIDMAMDFAVRAATPVRQGEKRSGKWWEEYADFSKWRQKLRWPSGEALRLGKEGKGEIDFVPAGRQGPDYAKRVNRFDWHNFYETLGGGAFFDAAKRKLDVYDYVLVDSRTGVSDTSGICTIHMPDTLVVCFTLNYQSIKGALAVAQSVREQRPEIRIFPLPTRVDGSETELLNRMKNYAAGVFGPLLDPKTNASEYWFSMEVPYFARYAYAEKLALFEEQASISASTLPAMVRLSEYLTDGSVRSAGKLPNKERARALAEFEGAEGKRARATPTMRESREVSSVHVFIAYSPQDHDVAQTIHEGLSEMHPRIEVFLDSSIKVGSDYFDAISTALEEADFLVVVDMGGTNRAGAYTGLEVGFFSALLQRESGRRIIYLYAGKPPALATQFLGIDIGIGDQDLRQGRTEYMEKSSDWRDDPLARLFSEIADRAEKLLPESSYPAGTAQRRENLINHIIPVVKGRLFDSMSARASRSLEQYRLEVELSAGAAGQMLDAMPQDARVTFHSGADALFGGPFKEDPISWQELSGAVRDLLMLHSLDRILTDAVSMRFLLENSRSQTIVSRKSGRVFNAMVSRRTDYFDGRKIVEVYLIERLVQWEFRKSETSIILAFIAQIARFNSIIESQSPVSVEAFIFEANPSRVQDKVRQFMEELRSIDDESLALGLDDPRNILIYLGDDDLPRLNAFVRHQENSNAARTRLFASADQVLHTPADSTQFRAAKDEWLAALTSFSQASREFQSTVTVPAIENLAKAFGDHSQAVRSKK